MSKPLSGLGDKTVKKAQKEVWIKVFNIISDCNYKTARDLIKLLEEARYKDLGK